MHSGIVQPSGPNIHFCISFGSVYDRYTDSGGAAKRLVTTTCLSPSVLRVSLLIVFSFLLAVSYQPAPRLGGRNCLSKLSAASRAIDRSLQHLPLRVGTVDSCPRLGAQ